MSGRCAQGFVLPAVLGIVLLAALFAVQAALELGNSTQLASQRLLQQRAFEAGESGITAAIEQLQAGTTTPGIPLLRSARFPTDSSSVETTLVRTLPLAQGHSAGLVHIAHHEIRSTGRSARGATVVVVQGVTQLQASP